MIDVTNGTDVYVGLCAYKLLLRHGVLSSLLLTSGPHGAQNQIRTGDLVLTKNALYLLSYPGQFHDIGPGFPFSPIVLACSLASPLVQGVGFEPTKP